MGPPCCSELIPGPDTSGVLKKWLFTNEAKTIKSFGGFSQICFNRREEFQRFDLVRGLGKCKLIFQNWPHGFQEARDNGLSDSVNPRVQYLSASNGREIVPNTLPETPEAAQATASRTHAGTKPPTCLSLQLTEPNWESRWWKTSLPIRLSSRCREQTLCRGTASPSVPGRRWALERQPQRSRQHLQMKVGPWQQPLEWKVLANLDA